jgi:hypothetical protein
LLLTETRAPVARHRPADDRLSPVIRTILRRFRRAVTRTGYAEAGLIAPLSAYHHRWSLRHGAPPARLVTVPVGVDPHDHPAAGQVAVYRAGPGDPPYPLIEAMMSGKAVVAADVGPVAETLGDAGVLVPADDPAALAAARAALLRDPTRRRDLGDAARRRALRHFTADRVLRAYDALYTDLAGPPPSPVFELTLAVPAPRATRPGSQAPSPSVPSRPGPHGPATVPDPGHPWSGRRRLTQEER